MRVEVRFVWSKIRSLGYDYTSKNFPCRERAVHQVPVAKYQVHARSLRNSGKRLKESSAVDIGLKRAARSVIDRIVHLRDSL